MVNAIDLYSPQSLDRAIRRDAPAHTFFLDTFYTRKKTFSTESVLIDIRKGGRPVAPFVHPRIGTKTVHSSGYETKEYTPPLVGPDMVTTADQLLSRMPGENPFSGISPAKRAVMKLQEDTQELKQQIIRREELMAVQTIFTGQIPVIGEGVNDVIDFGFSNKETLTGATQWDKPTSDPLKDLKRWHLKIQKKGSVNADIVVMSPDVVESFLAHAKVKEALDTKSFDLGLVKPKMLENGATYIGTIRQLALDIYQYVEWYEDHWSVEGKNLIKPMVPMGQLAMLSTRAKFTRNYAILSYIDQKTGRMLFVETDMLSNTYVERSPDRRILEMKSKPLPTPHEVNSWFVAEVQEATAVEEEVE